jgi:hypothetical protein
MKKVNLTKMVSLLVNFSKSSISIDYDFDNKQNALNLEWVKDYGLKYFEENYTKFDKNITKQLIDNSCFIIQNFDFFIENKFLQKVRPEVYAINVYNCEDYIKLPNRFERFMRNYSSTSQLIFYFFSGMIMKEVLEAIIKFF